VVQEVASRVVQRALLDVIWNVKGVRDAVLAPTSFGGLPERSVRDAIELASQEVNSRRAAYYIRSDVEGFFSNIPRQAALEELETLLPDDSLREFLEPATAVEMANQDELGALRQLFPSDERGVLQGHSLSALLGNLLLGPFDQLMNDSECLCLRYLDDFLILGPDKQVVWRFFTRGVAFLQTLGMDAYQPGRSEKADEGSAQRMFEFLGCEISRGFVRPSRKKRREFLGAIGDRLEESRRVMMSDRFNTSEFSDQSLVATLKEISASIHAWREQYVFCNYEPIQRQMDEQIDEILARYIGTYGDRKGRVGEQGRRRMLGVALVQDSGTEPIPAPEVPDGD
jgi:hypothetical protein